MVGQLGFLLFLPAPKVQKGGHGTHTEASKGDSNTQGDPSTEGKVFVGMRRRAWGCGRGYVGERRYGTKGWLVGRSTSGRLSRYRCRGDGCAGAKGGRKTIVGIFVLCKDEELWAFDSAVARIGLKLEPAGICRREIQWKGSGSVTGICIIDSEFCGRRERSVRLSPTASFAIASPSSSFSPGRCCFVKGKAIDSTWLLLRSDRDL